MMSPLTPHQADIPNYSTMSLLTLHQASTLNYSVGKHVSVVRILLFSDAKGALAVPWYHS